MRESFFAGMQQGVKLLLMLIGRSLALIPETDSFRKLTEDEIEDGSMIKDWRLMEKVAKCCEN